MERGEYNVSHLSSGPSSYARERYPSCSLLVSATCRAVRGLSGKLDLCCLLCLKMLQYHDRWVVMPAGTEEKADLRVLPVTCGLRGKMTLGDFGDSWDRSRAVQFLQAPPLPYLTMTTQALFLGDSGFRNLLAPPVSQNYAYLSQYSMWK